MLFEERRLLLPRQLHQQAFDLLANSKWYRGVGTNILMVPKGPKFDFRTSCKPSPAWILTLRASPLLYATVSWFSPPRQHKTYPRLSLRVKKLRGRHVGSVRSFIVVLEILICRCCRGNIRTSLKAEAFFKDKRDARKLAAICLCAWGVAVVNINLLGTRLVINSSNSSLLYLISLEQLDLSKCMEAGTSCFHSILLPFADRALDSGHSMSWQLKMALTMSTEIQTLNALPLLVCSASFRDSLSVLFDSWFYFQSF